MIHVLFDDDRITVCVKPVGIPSQSDVHEDLVKALSCQLNCSIFPINRVDTAVGGVMAFAKDKKQAADLTTQLQTGKLKKEYIAVVEGKPESDSGLYEDLLFKDSRKNKSYVVKSERKGVKRASLEYNVIESNDNISLVRVCLHTGRTHQIRVQFASRKMSLVGDGKYGSKDNKCTTALWSSKLSFMYLGKQMTFSSTPDFSDYPWNCFKNYNI